ncbi:hypothetical protein SCWH03_53380 [Streptomyces pacificus]|uniref:Uncharacterized protein n=1 Tax=Streptomyces pacificus TaxID=2705029 RepID=A0A6A0B2U6_9ACTN|nr:hypothetical protein SCWH03_53380 [Streptomyces pacificus]
MTGGVLPPLPARHGRAKAPRAPAVRAAADGTGASRGPGSPSPRTTARTPGTFTGRATAAVTSSVRETPPPARVPVRPNILDPLAIG